MLIAICGIDGSGKTTQIKKIKDYLEDKCEVYLTKQPTVFYRSYARFRSYVNGLESDEIKYELALLSAMDTGSSFEGMGASREACFSTIVEPAFFITMASIATLSQNYSFLSFKTILANAGIYGYLIIILAVVTLLVMLLVECCRVPVDDPTTHLELTMIHEVMILDNSGVDLGFITWASAIKMFLFEALIANLLIPIDVSQGMSVLLFILIVILLSVLVGTLESAYARFRMTHVFEFIFIMTITALLILALVTYRLYGN